MKKKYLFAVILLITIYAGQMFGYEIHFTSPTNGQSFPCGSNGTASVYISWSSSGQHSGGGYYYYTKLFTHNGSYSSGNGGTIPQWLYPGQGYYSWRIEMWEGNSAYQEYKVAEQTITFYVKYPVYVANNFGSGSINLEGGTVSSGSSILKLVGESVSVGAIDQSDGTYNRTWNASGTNNSNWKKGSALIPGATSRNYSYTVASGDNGITLTADLKKICILSFVNNYASIYLNGSSQSSPASANIVEQNTISASGNSYSSNGLIGTFSHWVKNGQTFSSSITPTAHGTYTAVYTHKPSNSGENVASSSPVGSPVTITWTDNINTAVNQYQIWRTVKHNGVNGTPQLLATVGRGVQSYTDYEYIKTSSYVDLLRYDVRAYYSTEGTYADESWHAVYGEMGLAKKNESELTVTAAKELPQEYAINNHPNPFNPTTTISYQLPEAGIVTIKVYDILGKKVAELVNENKQAGYYTVNFDVGRLTSGIYISTIQSGNFVQSKKMLMLK